MIKHTIVKSRLSAGFFRETQELASSELSVLALDTDQISALADSDPEHQFLVPVLRFETLMAELAKLTDFDEADSITRAVVDATKIIDVVKEFHPQVKVIDIELIAEAVSSDRFGLVSQMPWLGQLVENLLTVALPDALDRLIWMERRSDFGDEVAHAFDSLEKCKSASPRLDPERSRPGGPNGSFSRRHRLLNQVRDKLAPSELVLRSGTELARLNDKNIRLQQSLEQATISREIDDLIILQLQEELELALSETSLGSVAPRDGAIVSRDNVDVSPPLSRKPTQLPPRIPVKRWVLSLFMTPSTRAQIKLLKASDLFDPDWYWATYTDVAESGMTPEYHFIKFGAKEYRDPSPRFCTQKYLWQHPEINAAMTNPLVHFLRGASAEQ